MIEDARNDLFEDRSKDHRFQGSVAIHRKIPAMAVSFAVTSVMTAAMINNPG